MSGKNKKVDVYMCSVDVAHHIPDDTHGIRVYFSKKDIKKHMNCVSKGCGIIKATLDFTNVKTVQKEDWDLMMKHSKTLKELEEEDAEIYL